MRNRVPRGRLLRLCQKELNETIRDRRTVMTLLLMPLLVYPILSMALNRFVLSAGNASTAYRLGVASDSERDQLDVWLSDPMSLPPDAVLQSSGGDLANFEVGVFPNLTPQEMIEIGDADVGVVIDERTSPPTASFTAMRNNEVGRAARRILVERLQWLRLARAEQLASRRASFVEPVEVEVVDVGEDSGQSLLGTIVPLVLVLMTITGAVYPAIDLTAGERERGTMESVMASPVPRGAVLFSKYVAVVIVALLTAIANLTAMFTTLWASGLMPLLTGSDVFPWLAILRILGLLLLFSGFYSALLLSLTSFARSFKEAQAYLIPVMLVSLAPAMLALLPGANLNGALAILPLINIVLLARDTLSGSVAPAGAVAAIISTMAYAGAALAIASRLFGSDAVTRTSEKSIGSLLRRPREATQVPSPQAAALMLAMLVPIYFVVSNGLMRFLQQSEGQTSVELQLILNAAALILTFGCIPLITAFFERNRLQTTFRLMRPQWLSYIGAVMLGLGAWAFAHEAFVLADAIGIGGLEVEKIEQAQKTVDRMREASPVLLLAVFALTPGVIEELCFRGYLFSSFRSALTPTRTILVTAVLFGLFHVLTGNALLIERFVPSTMMGLLIGWVAYRTGSVLPGMVVHFVHNGLLNIVLYHQERLTFLGEGFDDQAHLPMQWIGGAGLLVIVGAMIVWVATRREQSEEYPVLSTP